MIMRRACKSADTVHDYGRMAGFSMVELVTVIVIVGIMGALAAPRFFDRNTFDSRGFYDQVISTLRYAQKAAIAQHRFVCVAFSANSITLTVDPVSPGTAHPAATCPGNNLSSPDGRVPYSVTSPGANVTLSGYADFNFDALGRASNTVAITVDSYTINIDRETGYVR